MATESAEDQIRRALARYCHHTDDGNYDEWVDLFTPDGSFHMFGQSHVGHTALRLFIEDDQPPHRRGLHLTTDSVINFRDGAAEVRSNFIFIASGETASVVVAAGRYHDILLPGDGRWLFQEREAVLVGPTATQAWGSAASDDPSVVPWFAVTRATPVERRGSYA
jgi:3-phenylpropionate/cinnamic acid dioxygenase small subunit